MSDDGRAPLLDSGFLRELEALRRRLVVRARSGGAGDRTSRRRGSSAEFEDHRPYAAGDDLRRIDWSAFARTGEPVLKLFRADEDAVARLVVDASASMRFGEPSKLDAARRLAAAMGFMTLARLDRAQIATAREGRARVEPPTRGRASLAKFLASLGAIEATGPGDLAKSIEAILLRSRRPGTMIVFSDFLDPGPVMSSLKRARAAGHEVTLAQVVAPDDVEPRLEGDLLLEDAETGETVELTADAAALDAYALRFAGLCEELRRFARSHGASYVRARTDEALEPAVRRMVDRAVD